MKTFTNTLRYLFIYLLLCVGTFLMLRGILAYSTFKSDTGFLAFKQDYLHITVWKVAFYTHVFSSIFTLLAGFTQFSNQLLKEHRQLHRLIGRLYAWNILLINFPAGMIMAIYANGYLPSKLAFIILDSLWFWFTLKAVIEIKRGNIAAHKRYMIRSYALTCSALTLRAWKLILSNSFTIDPVTLYMIDAWLGFVPNLLLAEWLIRRKKKRLTPEIKIR
ncbi:DUF2306 domain-containing protein [Chitinophaga niabensis]|uniref:DUF2306 domain-containing protein n=1 Tax=Chitinophaga niabensis TaxID=536979 RepID=UPI0031BB5494